MQIVATLFLPITIYLIIRKLKENKLTTLELLIVLLFFSSLLSIYLSPNSSVASKNVIYHSILLAIIPISYLVEHDEKININLLGKIISVFAVLSAGIGIVRYINDAERAYGFFGGYYTLASILAFSIPITFAFIFYSEGLWKYFVIGSTIIQSLAIWFTFTRSALLGLLIGGFVVIVILFFCSTISKSTKTKIAITLVFAVIAIIALLVTTSDTRLNPLLIFSNPDLSSGRHEIYYDAYEVFKTDLNTGWENIILGHGLESRIILYPKSLYTSWESDYVETFVSQGLVGLLLIILIYYQFFKRLTKLLSKVSQTEYYKLALGLLVSGIAFWTISFFSSQLVGRNSSAYFVVIYSLIIFIDRVLANDKTDSPAN